MTAPAVEVPAAADTPEGKSAAVVPAAEVPKPETPAAGVAPVIPVVSVVPESYTLTKPDGTLLSDTALDRVQATAKTLKLASDADAQALLGLADTEVKEVLTAYEAARAPGGTIHTESVRQYAEAGLKHPLLGNGDPAVFERKQLQAGLVLNKYAPELQGVLKARGYLLPEELVFLNRIHDAMSEKALAMPTKDAPPPERVPLKDQMYPKKTVQ